MSSRSGPRPHTRHPREQWSSKNRMLAGAAKKGIVVGRNPNFDTEETKLLIRLWGDPKVQRTLITTHKKHVVILQLASKMRQYGYDRSAEEITTRIKNLKCFYNRLKKDREGLDNPVEPSWRHFADMDEIMTRPIFSVRPNEVPAPSLKYQLEQKREERESRKRKALEEGLPLSESDEDIEDIIAVSAVPRGKNDLSDDGIIPDAEVDMDDADEAFAALMQTSPKKPKIYEEDEQDEDDDRLLIKEEFENIEHEEEKLTQVEKSAKSKDEQTKTPEKENPPSLSNNDDDTSDSCVALIIPKDEPIDVDDDIDDDFEANKQNPNMAASLGDMLKLTQNGMVAISSAGGNFFIPVSSTATSNASNNAAKLITTFSNNAMTTTSATGSPAKISLVPTNFLMQGQTVQNGVVNVVKHGQMPTQRFVLSGTQVTGQAKAPSAGIVTTGPGGMKVLLVNAEAAGNAGKICMPANLGQNIVASNATNAIGSVIPNINAQQKQVAAHQATTAAASQNQTQQVKAALKRNEEDILARKKRERMAQREELLSRREGTGMRNLLRTLLNVQTQNNELQKQRLSLERERLEFEKSAAERFFKMLPTLFAQQQQQQQQQAQAQPQQFFNLVPKQPATQQLRLNPTKLVFATGTLPSSAIVTPSISNVVSNNATHHTPIQFCTNQRTSTDEEPTTTTIINKIANVDANLTSGVETSDMSLLTPKVEKDD